MASRNKTRLGQSRLSRLERLQEKINHGPQVYLALASEGQLSGEFPHSRLSLSAALLSLPASLLGLFPKLNLTLETGFELGVWEDIKN